MVVFALKESFSDKSLWVIWDHRLD